MRMIPGVSFSFLGTMPTAFHHPGGWNKRGGCRIERQLREIRAEKYDDSGAKA
ncbi:MULTISPECIES: hypothetical protein [unclassified Shinella]|uniref:hypothetical protein n=1 Tax=unclassified Shinella TaxID=2643062 RepID=UPI00234E5473|nr:MULTISPECIES: hypothetical protein [unclassified Shinella]MCO5149762.1 hypothetical protein [Shinella sp.]MDC7262330.1 hypothetical protein [Shinella sp. HY16]MDC7269225.1 hypothetical protein [Shinella sp. YZ44]